MEKPLGQHPGVNRTDENRKLFNRMFLKAIANEMSNLNAQGSLGNKKNKDWDIRGSDGISEKEGDHSDHEENNLSSVPIFGDYNEQEDATSVKEVEDYLKHDDLGLGDVDGKEETSSPEGEKKDPDVFDDNEESIEEPNDYNVSSAPNKDEETKGNKENGIGEDGHGYGGARGNNEENGMVEDGHGDGETKGNKEEDGIVEDGHGYGETKGNNETNGIGEDSHGDGETQGNMEENSMVEDGRGDGETKGNKEENWIVEDSHEDGETMGNKENGIGEDSHGYGETEGNKVENGIVEDNHGDGETKENNEENGMLENNHEDGETMGNKENRIVEDGHENNERTRESEFKDSYSPSLNDEIKELGLNEYYIKDGFEEEQTPKQQNVDGELRHVLKKDNRVEGYRKRKPKVKRPLEETGTRGAYGAYVRKHNSHGDEIERRPSDRREDNGVERSHGLEEKAGSFEHPGHLITRDGDVHRGDSLPTYLDDVGKYIGKLDGTSVARQLNDKQVHEQVNKDANFAKALVFNAKDDSVVSKSPIENPRVNELASRENHALIHKGDTLDDEELEKDGLISLRASEYRPKGTIENKKSSISTSLPNAKRHSVKTND